MGNVINLNRFRKRAEREASAQQAETKRAKFGRTKAQASGGGNAREPGEGASAPASDRPRGTAMKSPVVKRSIVVAGHKTSVSLEEAFWQGMKDISGLRGMTS